MMVMAFGIILLFLCIGEFIYILHIQKQLAEWLDFLKSLHHAPKRNSFVKGNDILADINFELTREVIIAHLPVLEEKNI
ncbi:hypothetical protein [Roseburia sp. 1XD42-69]|uniref:hypothetical protein n=1 Tax=Roseburia sp. 1XD42-69 TaxID=2320088 RepID=UPI000EA25FCA|nr:hypothetical protein [Roseburia sp. 1XD42-69]RKJ68221.1 hypothetical protein D7Y06_02380 [Roseburia sp. 1XD42-69]